MSNNESVIVLLTTMSKTVVFGMTVCNDCFPLWTAMCVPIWHFPLCSLLLTKVICFCLVPKNLNLTPFQLSRNEGGASRDVDWVMNHTKALKPKKDCIWQCIFWTFLECLLAYPEAKSKSSYHISGHLALIYFFWKYYLKLWTIGFVTKDRNFVSGQTDWKITFSSIFLVWHRLFLKLMSSKRPKQIRYRQVCTCAQW